MSRLIALLSALSLSLALVTPVSAGCMGQNLIDALPPDQRAALEAATDAVPFASGNFWRATRGEEVIIIAGTSHLDEPRHAATIAALAPHIRAATTVLVEAGPDEEKALMSLMAKDPSKMVITTGPTLNQQLPPELWDQLSDALAQRGIPGFMAAKFRPWYALAILSIPPCAMAEMAAKPKGLDGLVIDTATAANVPVRGLEPFDTIFTIFDGMTEAQLADMLKSTLALEDRADDYFRTLTDSYFAGESREIWEFMRLVSYDMPGYTREEVDAEFRQMEEALMNKRNRGWIPVLTEAAAQGQVFAAFGALHLSGEEGVLALLQDAGFEIKPLNLP